MNLKKQKLHLLLFICFLITAILGCATGKNNSVKQPSPSRPAKAQTAKATYVTPHTDTGITAATGIGTSTVTGVYTDTGTNTDLSTKTGSTAAISTKTLRVDRPDLDGLKSAFDRIKQAKGTVVVFLGDSQTYGSYVSAKDTIPAYLEQALTKRYPGRVITVINLGIKGLKPADAYLIIRQLASMKVDMLIYNITRGWFYPSNSLTYPVLIKLTGAEKEAARWNIELPAPSRGGNLPRTVPQSTYSSGSAASGNTEQKKKPVILYWRQNPDLIPKGPKTKLAPLALNEKNLQWQLYLAAIQTWNNTGRPALFYLSPTNWELLNLKYNIDFSQVNKEYREIADAAATQGIPCQDYTHLVTERLFVDEVHLQKKGHLQVSTKLDSDIATLPAARKELTRKVPAR